MHYVTVTWLVTNLTIAIVTAQHQQTHTRLTIPIIDSNLYTRGSDGRPQSKEMLSVIWYSKLLQKLISN